MDRDVPGQPLVLHTLPGRLRVHVPRWPAPDAPRLEQRLRGLPGVTHADANPLTGNVLILYDPAATHPAALLAGLRGPPPTGPGSRRHPPSRLAHGRAGKLLESGGPGLALLGSLMTPAAAPSAPSAARRLLIALAGLGLLAYRRQAGYRRLVPTIGPLALVLEVLGFLQALPPVQALLARFLGRRLTALLREATEAVTLLLSGSPTRLAVAGVRALLQLSRTTVAAQPVAA